MHSLAALVCLHPSILLNLNILLHVSYYQNNSHESWLSEAFVGVIRIIGIILTVNTLAA